MSTIAFEVRFILSTMLHLIIFISTFFTSPTPLVRLAEIEIKPGHEKAYVEILNEEVRLSLEKEPGVWAILPTVDGQKVRILEVYADTAAYQSHILSPHFLHYKKATEHMIATLVLKDLKITDPSFLAATLKKAK